MPHHEKVVPAHRGGIVVTFWRIPQAYLAGSAPCLKEKDGCAFVIGEAAVYALVFVECQGAGEGGRGIESDVVRRTRRRGAQGGGCCSVIVT